MITSYNTFITEKLNINKISIPYDDLISTFNGEEVDTYDTFKLQKSFYKDRMTLSFLNDNIEFINSLSSLSLKKSKIQNSDDYQTFIDTPIRWMLIYGYNDNELQDPQYILIEKYINNTWTDLHTYKINGPFKNFYDKLTSKTIEFIDDDDKYIYSTSDTNTWELQNINDKNKKYKKFYTKDEMHRFISDNKNIKVNVV